ncbi:MAG: hypothetical protein HY648_08345 [Acidobacteria bacterium]|nr:hypothetical protein [Acidobacteriota bacterium]
MPKIQWTSLPPSLRDHLFERLRERKIQAMVQRQFPDLPQIQFSGAEVGKCLCVEELIRAGLTQVG